MRAASKLAEESRVDRWSSHTAGVISECGDHAKGAVSQHTDSQRNSSKQVWCGGVQQSELSLLFYSTITLCFV